MRAQHVDDTLHHILSFCTTDTLARCLTASKTFPVLVAAVADSRAAHLDLRLPHYHRISSVIRCIRLAEWMVADRCGKKPRATTLACCGAFGLAYVLDGVDSTVFHKIIYGMDRCAWIGEPKKLPAVGLGISSIFAGDTHVLLVDVVGAVWSAGEGHEGQLGHGLHITCMSEPRCIIKLADVLCVQASAGSKHSLVLSQSGAVFSFGCGGDGQLGTGKLYDEFEPKRIEALKGVAMQAVSGGGLHSLGLSANGDAYWWGSEYASFYGDRRPRPHRQLLQPSQITVGERVSQVCLGGGHSLLLGISGQLYSFGNGEFAQLGGGTATGVAPRCSYSPEPTPICSFLDVRVQSISACAFHSAAITCGGELYTWGHPGTGALGHGPTNFNSSIPFSDGQPRRVEAVQHANSPAVESASGRHMTLVRLADNEILILCEVKGRLAHPIELHCPPPSSL